MNPQLADQIKVVLVETTHPGNIGSTARAMKVMGLHRLVLVNPERFPSEEAVALASNADDVLEQAEVVDDFAAAIAGCQYVLACTARTRSLPLPGLPPRQAAESAVTEVLDQGHQVAIVFGRERSGLTTEEAQLSNALVHIPTSDTYRSLNLAQAVQIMSYEIRMAALEREDQSPQPQPPSDWVPEPLERLDYFFVRLEDGLRAINFLNPAQPKRLMQRLRRLFIRARPDENELNILNGVVSSMLESAARNRPIREVEKESAQ